MQRIPYIGEVLAGDEIGDIRYAATAPSADHVLADGSSMALPADAALINRGVVGFANAIFDSDATVWAGALSWTDGYLYAWTPTGALYRKNTQAGAWTLVLAAPDASCLGMHADASGFYTYTFNNSATWTARFTPNPNTTAWAVLQGLSSNGQGFHTKWNGTYAIMVATSGGGGGTHVRRATTNLASLPPSWSTPTGLPGQQAWKVFWTGSLWYIFHQSGHWSRSTDATGSAFTYMDCAFTQNGAGAAAYDPATGTFYVVDYVAGVGKMYSTTNPYQVRSSWTLEYTFADGVYAPQVDMGMIGTTLYISCRSSGTIWCKVAGGTLFKVGIPNATINSFGSSPGAGPGGVIDGYICPPSGSYRAQYVPDGITRFARPTIAPLSIKRGTFSAYIKAK